MAIFVIMVPQFGARLCRAVLKIAGEIEGMAIDHNIGTLTEPISGRHWDRAEIRRQVAGRVRKLLLHGFEPGDRVLIHFGNRLEFFAELLAIWRLGGCAIPVDSRLTAFEVGKLASSACARFSIVDDAASQFSLPEVTVLQTLDDSDGVPGSRISGARPALDEDALILFTSGSTGQPKGVVHTYRSLYARWTSLRDCLGVSAFRRTLCVLPTHFGHGLICNCLFPWLSGCDLYIAPPFQSEVLMQLGALIDDREISFVSSVPSVWNLALKAAQPPKKGSLQRVHVGSAPLSAGMWTDIQEWTATQAVVNAYGITETGSWVAGSSAAKVAPESGMIGSSWGATISVMRQDTTAEPLDPQLACATGEEGMIWLNTPGLMQGYFQRQDLTDAVISQGWFMTGDIGVIDERGQLFLRGRERDEINKGGQKVFPADIDEVVQQFPAVSDACTFRIEDSFYGENIGIAIVLGDKSDTSIRELHDWINTHLAEHKQPVRWHILEEIPRTSRGKINRDSVMQACSTETPLDMRAILQRENRG